MRRNGDKNMDKLATDTKESKITDKSKWEKRIEYVALMYFIYNIIWGLTYLFTVILHALGKNDVRFSQVANYFICLSISPICLLGMRYAPKIAFGKKIKKSEG